MNNETAPQGTLKIKRPGAYQVPFTVGELIPLKGIWFTVQEIDGLSITLKAREKIKK